MAALTSAISILEVITSYFIDEKGWSREKATITFGSIVTVVGIFCSMSMGGFDDFTKIFNISFFDFLDYLSSKYMLPIGGLLTSVFILYKWGLSSFIQELTVGMQGWEINRKVTGMFFILSAVIVAFILLNEIISIFTGTPIIAL